MTNVPWIAFSMVAALWAAPALSADPPKIKDAESATHGGDAAMHQIVDTYRFPGFGVVQVNLPVLSHYSYILVSGKEALVVDPDRDVQFYLDYAAKTSLTIKGVYLTHSHADFVAGHLEIVKAALCVKYCGVSGSSRSTAEMNSVRLLSTR